MSDEHKKASAREQYGDFVRDHFGKELGQLSSRQQSHGLTRFYISEIHNCTRTHISEDDIERALVDGHDDLGVDFLHRDDNLVLVIQAKYIGKKGSTVTQEEIENFQSVFMRLTDPDFRARYALEDLIAGIDFSNDTFQCIFLCLGKIEGQADIQSKKDPVLPSQYDSLADRVTYEYLDETGLNEELRNALMFSSGIPGECELVAAGSAGRRSAVVELDAAGRRSFIMVVGAKQLVNLWTRYKDSLFTLNIRNYIGSTETNKNIIATATRASDNFFFFNNGISCLATRVIPPQTEAVDRVTVEGIQIINGAQTVKSLVKASARTQSFAAIEEPLLLVRITEVPKGYAEGGTFRNEMIRFNNTQNVIRVSDFRSNDPIQADLKRRFAGIHRNGKVVDYIAKRTDHTKPNSISVKLEEFCKVVYSFLGDPVSFSESTSFLFDDAPQAGYCTVFGDGRDVWDVMPDDEFELRSAIWWLGSETGSRLSREKKEAAEKLSAPGSYLNDDDRERVTLERSALERKWMVIYATRLVLERSHPDDYRRLLGKTFRGDWTWDDEHFGKWLSNVYSKARASVVHVYQQASKTPGFTHRNWMRSKETPKDLKDLIMRGLLDPVPPP